MGATSLGLSFGRAAAIGAGRPTLFVSLDWSEEVLMRMLLAAESRVQRTRFDAARLNNQDQVRLASAVSRISNAPMYIDDRPRITGGDLFRRVSHAREAHGIELVKRSSQGSRVRR
jgi:replicative DNA helicase